MLSKVHYSQKALLLLFNAISCLTIIVFAVVIYQQSRTSKNYGDWVRHTYQILSASHHLLNGTAEIESSYRGYLLTGIDDFLEPVSEIEKNIFVNIEYLQNIPAKDDRQAQSIALIKEKFLLFKRLLEQQKEIYKTYGASGLVVSDINASRKAMLELQSELNIFMESETRKLDRRLFLENTEHYNQVSTIIIGTGIAVLGLIISNVLISLLMSSGARTSRRLEHIQELYEIIQDNVNDGLYDCNLVTKQITFSPSYNRQLGYAANEIKNFDEGFRSLLHPDDIERVTQEMDQFRYTVSGQYSSTYRLRHRDGRWLWMLSRAVGTWDENGKMIRMLGIHTDITDQKRQENALRELNNEMESFTYIASHDLRSPLVNLKGFSREIATSLEQVKKTLDGACKSLTDAENNVIKQMLEQDIPESLGFIDKAVERMDSLTSAILNLSRIGRRVYKPVHVNVNEVVARCISALNYEINATHSTITVENLPDVFADELAIEQIFSNLLDNAIKYLNPSIPGQISISGTNYPYEIVYAIKDNGRGIDKKDAEKIFSIFRRARNASDVRGMGMGLAFIKTMVRKMSGRIWYESIPEKGTIFYFSIPQVAIEDGNNES